MGHLWRRYFTANSLSQKIEAFGGNDTIDSGAGSDRLVGGLGDDTYVFGYGYGQDTVAENDFSPPHEFMGNDTLRFATGVRPQDVRLTADNNRLTVTLVGSTDTLLIQDHSINGVERAVFSDGTIWNLVTNPSAPSLARVVTMCSKRLRSETFSEVATATIRCVGPAMMSSKAELATIRL